MVSKSSHPLVWILALLLLGCPDDVPTPADANGPEDEAVVTAVCLEGEPFVTEGAVPVEGTTPGDADRIGDLRWEAHDGCERVVIDLLSENDAPAESTGTVNVEVLREMGIVRVSLRDVERVEPDATDASFDGPLAQQAYAVWSPDGRWTFVDLHLGEAAEVHAAVLDSPARVVIDLRPGGAPLPDPPTTSDRVVVLEPRRGPASYPLTVTGYARTFEANVVVRLEQDGEDVYDDFTTATAWVDAWGHYEFTIPEGPTGALTLHVGEHSARDGTWEGAEVDLEMR